VPLSSGKIDVETLGGHVPQCSMGDDDTG